MPRAVPLPASEAVMLISKLMPQGTSFASDSASEGALEDLRESLKLGIKAVWSQEAVRRGVAAAKVHPSSHLAHTDQQMACAGNILCTSRT